MLPTALIQCIKSDNGLNEWGIATHLWPKSALIFFMTQTAKGRDRERERGFRPGTWRWACSSIVCVARRGRTVSGCECCLWSSESWVHPAAFRPSASPSAAPPAARRQQRALTVTTLKATPTRWVVASGIHTPICPSAEGEISGTQRVARGGRG